LWDGTGNPANRTSISAPMDPDLEHQGGLAGVGCGRRDPPPLSVRNRPRACPRGGSTRIERGAMETCTFVLENAAVWGGRFGQPNPRGLWTFTGGKSPLAARACIREGLAHHRASSCNIMSARAHGRGPQRNTHGRHLAANLGGCRTRLRCADFHGVVEVEGRGIEGMASRGGARGLSGPTGPLVRIRSGWVVSGAGAEARRGAATFRRPSAPR